MLDILAALEWIMDNIENFGGDPAKRNNFGQSGAEELMGMSLPAQDAIRSVAELLLECRAD